MRTGATKWVWENSRASNGSLIVLLAIADECGEGEFTEMSVAELMRKCRLSDKGVRLAVKDLAALGELIVEPHRGGASRYALPPPTPVKTTGPPRQNLPDHPGKNYRTAETTDRQNLPDPPEEPQVSDTPAESTGPQISNKRSTTTGIPMDGVKPLPAKAPRADADRLCDHLADRIEANGAKRPKITQKWRDSARLMLDSDGRTEDQIHAAIDWCQDDEFWRANILSMPKLREKYETLRMRAMRGKQRNSRQVDESLFDDARQLARALDEREAGIDPRGNGHANAVHPRALPSAGR